MCIDRVLLIVRYRGLRYDDVGSVGAEISIFWRYAIMLGPSYGQLTYKL